MRLGQPRDLPAFPSPGQVLRAGDIIQHRRGHHRDGWFATPSRMYFVGEASPLARRLVDTTYEAMCAGIAQGAPGATLGDVGHAIQTMAHRERFSVVRILRPRHRAGVPDVPRVLRTHGQRGQGLRLEEGMVFTIGHDQRPASATRRSWPTAGWTRDPSLPPSGNTWRAVTGRRFLEVLTPRPGTEPLSIV